MLLFLTYLRHVMRVLRAVYAPGLWRLLGWMEAHNHAFDLYSETELHHGRIPLDAYRAVVLDQHPEYWSTQMFEAVKSWVDNRGGRVMYLGGCGLYAEVTFETTQPPTTDAGGADGDGIDTILCHREGKAQFGGLLGVQYDHDGFIEFDKSGRPIGPSGAPFKVAATAVQHLPWIFEGSGLKAGDLFGMESLHTRVMGGASAHELDKIGEHSPPGTVLLAKGQNRGGGGAEVAYYDTASGGRVFAASSLCWVLALPIDQGVSKITDNVLKAFTAPPP